MRVAGAPGIWSMGLGGDMEEYGGMGDAGGIGPGYGSNQELGL